MENLPEKNQQLFPYLLGERPYKCHVPDCGRAFIQLSNLQQHLRNHESQLERLKNRPFHCHICGKGFATESSLRTHNGKVNVDALIELVVLSTCILATRIALWKASWFKSSVVDSNLIDALISDYENLFSTHLSHHWIDSWILTCLQRQNFKRLPLEKQFVIKSEKKTYLKDS